MEYVPKKHQIIAADFLRAHDRCALFLDMGLGKTVVTLTRIKELIDALVIRRALVIAPLRVAETTWSTEAEKWDHLKGLRVSCVIGDADRRKRRLATDADVYVINRENVQWLVEGLQGRWPFDCVVVDELSSFKNHQAKRWRYLRRVIKSSDYVIGLTGTPAPNGYMDLWPEIYLIDNGEALGNTVGKYRDKYFNPGRRNGQVVWEWVLKPGAKEAIDSKIKPFCLSMSKEDWLEMPPLMTNIVSVHIDRKERAVYNQLMRDRVLPLLNGELSTMQDMDSAVVGSTAAVLSNKLLQMANGAVYDEDGQVYRIHDKKLDALEELLGATGDNVLVFYNYKHDRDRILERFPEARVLEGPKDIEDWNAGEIRIMLCHPASAAYGINLQQGGHTVAWFGLPWSLELHEQANARLHRQGQEYPVMVHYIVASGTLDERVLRVLQQKDAVQASLLNALKDFVKEEDKICLTSSTSLATELLR